MALDEALAGVAHLVQHPGLIRPAGVLALQVVAKEFLLHVDAVVGVKLRPVLDAVDFEPFLLTAGFEKTLEVPARVEALSAPVGG